MNIKEFSKKIGVPISTISKALGGYKDVNINAICCVPDLPSNLMLLESFFRPKWPST